jgi:hypothetical protein
MGDPVTVAKIAAASAVLIITACAPPPSLNGPELLAREQCDAEAAKVGGYDWVDATLRRSEARERCMRLKGFGR